MAIRAKAIGVGAFVILGLLLFSTGLFLIGNRRMVFQPTFETHAYFANIAGLQKGGKVRVAGMDAGEVRAIHVPSGPSAKFLVVLQIREDLHNVVRTDSVASIQNDGLVGNKFVQVEAGTDKAPLVAEKGTIRSVEPFDFGDLLARMSDTVTALNKAILDVKVEVDDTLVTIADTVDATQDLITDVGTDVTAISASGQQTAADVQAIVAGLRQGRGSVGKLLTDDALYLQARDISTQAQKAITNLREASEQAKQAVADLRGQGGSMKGLSGNLTQTLNYARDAMADLAENAEALKHNFLFRGFFNRRGYFDLSDVSVQQYRQGMLEAAGRVPLRIWLGTPVVFGRDANGKEVLTGDGRARIDSAMSQFVRYPKTSPLVVEGYAQEPTGDAQFLMSRGRAELARDYIIERFGLDPRSVAVMAMGAQAPNSPTGDTWDGIALTLFVAKEAFETPKPVAQGLINHR
jgi:phospholipid/cholesterol/gamma-HCH transport system substrate-binding protein